MSGILRGLARSRVLLVALVVLAVALVAVGWRLVTRQDPTRVTAMFSNSVGLYPGSDVRVLGLPVGTVTKITPVGKEVRVSMDVDPDQKVAADTGAAIVAPTLVSDRYVQFTEPWDTGSASMRSGAFIPESRTATPVEVDELYKSLDDLSKALGPNGANKDGSLSRLVKVGADNLDGNGQKINTVLREFGKLTGTLSGSDDDLFDTVSNLKDFNDTLAANDRGVAKVNDQLADVTGYLAEDRTDLQDAVKNLGAALAVIDDFIRENRDNLTASVTKLIGPTRTLVRQQDSLEESVRDLPLALQNFLKTYDAKNGQLQTRLNLNELSVWAGAAQQPAPTATPNSKAKAAGKRVATTQDAPVPPVLLPGLGEDR
ncbi:ABC transporter substrate-binding protein [Marmoricola endophyticus]|uniref:ABC transporter substrate-binding protein n=1 Tax=Marmoricola endophyticus TaxID=2040280 RepID=A0A917F077_9ACTN|nr:MCE family protein [Marmoricola endophyticus]GGF37483.1 ABC transporter substrate-binding protein [Marmoricola endophyticus]